MRKLLLLIGSIFLCLSLAGVSAAVEFPRLPDASGDFKMKAAPAIGDTETTEICFHVVNVTPNVEVGCLDIAGGAPDPGGVFDVIVEAQLPVMDPGQDAIIRAQAINAAGLVSTFSADNYLVDFTIPGEPVLLSSSGKVLWRFGRSDSGPTDYGSAEFGRL